MNPGQELEVKEWESQADSSLLIKSGPGPNTNLFGCILKKYRDMQKERDSIYNDQNNPIQGRQNHYPTKSAY